MTLLQKARSCNFLAVDSEYPAQNPGFSIGPYWTHSFWGPFLMVVLRGWDWFDFGPLDISGCWLWFWVLMAFPGCSLQMFPHSGDLPKSKTSMGVVSSCTGNQMTPIPWALGILNLETFEHDHYLAGHSRGLNTSRPPPGTVKSCNAQLRGFFVPTQPKSVSSRTWAGKVVRMFDWFSYSYGFSPPFSPRICFSHPNLYPFSRQDGRPASQPASKQARQQARKPASKPASKQALQPCLSHLTSIARSLRSIASKLSICIQTMSDWIVEIQP